MKKKILFITWTRAEYWILEPLILGFKKSGMFDVRILVTWMHTLKAFWLTKETIKKRMNIDYEVWISPNGDQTTRLWEEIIGIHKKIKQEKMDFIVVLWDRDEAFAWAIVWSHLRIPVIHIHWGDTTWHIPDEYIRNAITKMSHIHFVACKQHYQKIQKMWENTKLIFDVWALCFDWIYDSKLWNRKKIAESLWLNVDKKRIMFVLHPSLIDTEFYSFKQQISLIDILPKDTENIIIYPNSDTWTQIFIDKIRKIENKTNYHTIKSLDRNVYLSLFKHANIVIGNSSSGIIESEAFTTPVINVGNRQKWRKHSKRVFDISYEHQEYKNKIDYILKNEKKIREKTIKKYYFHGNVTKKIIDILSKINTKNLFEIKI